MGNRKTIYDFEKKKFKKVIYKELDNFIIDGYKIKLIQRDPDILENKNKEENTPIKAGQSDIYISIKLEDDKITKRAAQIAIYKNVSWDEEGAKWKFFDIDLEKHNHSEEIDGFGGNPHIHTYIYKNPKEPDRKSIKARHLSKEENLLIEKIISKLKKEGYYVDE